MRIDDRLEQAREPGAVEIALDPAFRVADDPEAVPLILQRAHRCDRILDRDGPQPDARVSLRERIDDRFGSLGRRANPREQNAEIVPPRLAGAPALADAPVDRRPRDRLAFGKRLDRRDDVPSLEESLEKGVVKIEQDAARVEQDDFGTTPGQPSNPSPQPGHTSSCARTVAPQAEQVKDSSGVSIGAGAKSRMPATARKSRGATRSQ